MLFNKEDGIKINSIKLIAYFIEVITVPWIILLSYYIIVSFLGFTKMPEVIHNVEKGFDLIDALLLFGAGLFAELVASARYFQKAKNSIQDFTKQFDQTARELRSTGIDTLQICLNFMNNIFNGSIFDVKHWSGFNQAFPTRVQESINSISATLKAWSDKIQVHSIRERKEAEC